MVITTAVAEFAGSKVAALLEDAADRLEVSFENEVEALKNKQILKERRKRTGMTEPRAVTDYYVLSLRWTRTGEECITWWGPNNAGYVCDLDNAGRYTEDQVSSKRSYYDNRETTLAVPCVLADRFARRIVHADSMNALASELLGKCARILTPPEPSADESGTPYECGECGRGFEYPGPSKLVEIAE